MHTPVAHTRLILANVFDHHQPPKPFFDIVAEVFRVGNRR